MQENTTDTANKVQEGGARTRDQIINHPFVIFLIKLLLAIVTVGFLIIISKFISRSIANKIINNSTINDEEYNQKIGTLVGDIVYYALAVFSLFIGFEIVGLNVSIFLGGLSLGIGFAFKEILGNLLAGIMILTTKEYKLGDIIEIDGSKKYFGRIEEITMRNSIIRTFDLRRVIIPNLQFIMFPVITYTTEEFIRIETLIGIHYDSDLQKSITILQDCLKNSEYLVQKDKNQILIDQFADNSINLRIWCYFNPNQGILLQDAISKVNQTIYDALKKNNIEIPYPHTVITVDKNDKNLLSSAIFLINKNKEK